MNELILIDDVERPVQEGDQGVNNEDQVVLIVVETESDHGVDQAQELHYVGVEVRLEGFLHATEVAVEFGHKGLECHKTIRDRYS